MKTHTPEISWHNRLPALSLDISKPIDDSGKLYRIATGGNDCRVYIWTLSTNLKTKGPVFSIMAGLRRHQRSVGAVKFSSEHLLASGDDDGYIYIWKYQSDNEPIESNAFLNDDGFEDLEQWQQQRVLRGHLEDICDLAWSKDGQYLLSGSVDNSAILWDAHKGNRVWASDLIKGYVQGVAIDPHSQYLAALSSDRTMRIYNFTDKRLVYAVRQMNLKNNYKAFFCDDTVQTFCRRFEFSPDGQFILAPTSRVIEKEPREPKEVPQAEKQQPDEAAAASEDTPKETSPATTTETATATEPEKPEKKEQEKRKEKKPINVVLVFRRSSLNKPITYYPTGREVALCVRFNPVAYALRDNERNFWGLPYRLIFAIATSRSVIIYDSQQQTPIGYVSQIHLARLTDLAWSSDGRLLMVSSYDGYSSLITFDPGEFGELHTGPLLGLPEPQQQEEPTPTPASEITPTSTPPKRGQKRSITPRDSEVPKKEKLAPEKEPVTTIWKYLVRGTKAEPVVVASAQPATAPAVEEIIIDNDTVSNCGGNNADLASDGGGGQN